MNKIQEQFESKTKHCIECGKEVESTYEMFCGKFIRLIRCPHCSQTVDKYIEYDNILIFINLLLQKQQVYRHVLFNKQNVFSFLFKVFIGTILLQALVQNLFSSNVVVSFLKVILMLVEDVIYCSVVSGILSLITKLEIKECFRNVFKSCIIRSVGKIFFIFVLIGNYTQAVYLFTIVMSNMIFFTCISVLFNISQIKTLIIGVCGSLLYQVIMLNLFNPGFFDNFIQTA